VSAVLAEGIGRAPIVPLSEVADLVRGVSYPKSDAREEPAPGFVPVLRATNIQEARLVLDSDLVFVADRNVSPDQLLRPNDIVVATSSGSKHLVGKSGQLHAAWHGSFH
jgi:type I restriction enzyme S subunit